MLSKLGNLARELIKRFLLIFYVFDNLVLALITLGKCEIGETLSSCAWEIERDGKGAFWRKTFDFCLRWAETDHCRRAWVTYQKLRGWKQ